MNKIALFPWQDSAVGFYRILQPGRMLKREGLVNTARSIPFSGEQQGQFYEYSDKTYLEMTEGADVMWSNIVYRPDMIIKFLNLRKLRGNKMVYDMDDNFYGVPADNPASEEVKPLRKNFESCIRSADGLTVSTPLLKKIYEPLTKHIFVTKNGLDFALWDKLSVKKSKKIRIGWRGAFGHKDDLEMIEGALKAIKKDYDVEIVTLGWNGFKLADETNEFVSTFEYPAKLASLKLDIGIVPLVDSIFNRCKSNIAYLEYSALKIPTVVSPVENQKGMVSLEAESNYDWYQAIEKLIKDVEYRRQLGNKANEFVKKEYNVKNIVRPLAKWFDELPRKNI